MTATTGLTREQWEKRPLHHVRALVMLDAAGGGGYTPDEEFAEIVVNWRDLYDIDISNAKRSDTFSPSGQEADGCDLVVFDWGGASIGNDMLQHQVRWLINWAGDHPSALIVVRSLASTFLEVAMEREDMPDLPNVIADTGDLKLPNWWLAGLDEPTRTKT